jgi:hypothetical protein
MLPLDCRFVFKSRGNRGSTQDEEKQNDNQEKLAT